MHKKDIYQLYVFGAIFSSISYFFNLWDSMNYIFFPVTFIYFICELSTGSLYLIFSADCLAMNYCYINIFFYKLICILFILKQFHKFILAINLCDKVIGESKYCTLHINVIQHVYLEKILEKLGESVSKTTIVHPVNLCVI